MTSKWNVLAILLLAAVGLRARPAVAQVVDTPGGRVEFIGLHHWTPEQVRDTLAALRPDVPLSSGACAGVLQMQAGFPQAAVNRFAASDGHFEEHVVITLVEPEEKARVRYLAPPADSLPSQERWSEAHALIFGGGWGWGVATQFRDRPLPEEYLARLGNPDTTDFHAARMFLETHATEEDYRLALETLAGDRNGRNRVVAIGILGSFPERQETWHALIRSARGFGEQDWGRGQAAMAIGTLAPRAPQTMDWSPVADDLSALMGGTNLFAFMPLLELLARTGLSAEMTATLLANGSPLVMDHLAAESPVPKQAARRFLEKVSGESYGDDVEAWQNWIAGFGV
ncbi:MAG TPA: hypothetical protein VJ982_08835 [Gemmatimonadota bacterium]|nr:hypothetical protein [Gemmatimonadota bacterium]